MKTFSVNQFSVYPTERRTTDKPESDNRQPRTDNRRGFTLVELLVIITIIAIIAVTVLINVIPASLKRGRDTARKSDLKQYQTALENYANENATLYPSAANVVTVTTLCSASSDPLYKYISQCINDKKAGSNGFTYSYASDTLKWALDAKLELNNQYWVVCSNGKSGTVSSAPTITNGACPL